MLNEGMPSSRNARAGRWLCFGGATLGAVGLLGNIVGAESLTTMVPGQPPMMPNTGLTLLLIGTAGALRYRENAGRGAVTVSVLAALFVLAIGVGTLAEYTLATDLHVDQLFVHSEGGPYPGRPSPPTALALACLAAALLFIDFRPTAHVRPSEWLVLASGLTALTAFLGFAFGSGPLYRLAGAPIVGVAVPTAVSLLLTSVGLLLERPSAGIMRVATSPGPGGMLLRRLALPAILAPMLLGHGVTRLSTALGIDELSISLAILASTMTVVSLLLLSVTAERLNRTHEALESARTRTQSLVEQAPDGIFVADLSGRYTDVNDAGCHMLGYTREEIIGKTIVDLISPEEVDRLWQSKEQLLEGKMHSAEWRLRSKSGGYIPVEVNARILPDGRWQGFVRDISERKRLENELRISEAKATGILSVSADAIISIDEAQHITLFNEGAEKIFGYSAGEAVGAPLDILIPERLRAIHREHVARFAAGPEIARRSGNRDTAILGLRKSGEEFPADAAISKLEVAGTRVLTAVLRDITEQKRIENEQRFLAEMGPVLALTLDYEETLSKIAQVAVRALADFCVVDLIDEDGEVRRLRAVSRDPSNAWICDLLQRISLDRRRPDLVWSALETRQPVLMQRLPTADIERLVENEEHLRALRATELQSGVAIPLVARGKLLGVITLLSATPSRVYGSEDIRLAQELAQRAALAVDNALLYRTAQRAVQVRDDVLSIVAHDLRNPLGSILIVAGLLRGSAQRVPERVEAIERAAKRMNRLIQDLLDISRMEAGQLTIDRVRLSAAQIVSDATEVQRPLASSTSVELRLDLAQDLPELSADRDRLLQVFENLIGNALKFTPPAGCITIGAAPRDTDVLFWVNDTGAGIAADDQPHLFDRFWQARKADRRGTGLGLPIVKGIVEAHGGRVWVESSPGRGSTFFFTIPAAPRPVPAV